MKFEELKDVTVDELVKKERNLREDLFKLKFKHKIHRLDNTSQIRQLRKSIARIQTALSVKSAI